MSMSVTNNSENEPLLHLLLLSLSFYFFRSRFRFRFWICTNQCSLRVRPHPKPQVRMEYTVEGSLKLGVNNKVKVTTTNLSSHLYEQLQYPFITEGLNEGLMDSFIIDLCLKKVIGRDVMYQNG